MLCFYEEKPFIGRRIRIGGRLHVNQPLHHNAVMQVSNEKKGMVSFFSQNINKNPNESHFHYNGLKVMGILNFLAETYVIFEIL